MSDINNLHRTKPVRSWRQRGSIAIVSAGILVVLTGLAVAVLDVARIFIVRTELQNAADAAALSGANCLDRQSLSTSANECAPAYATTLNWARASARATAQLSANTADNRPLSSTDSGHVVEVGYWNLATNTPSGGTLSTTFSPPGQYDKPAVRVKVSKAAGMNGGPIRMLSSAMFGGADVPMSASAVAVISSPGAVPPATIIPQVINKCMYNKFWNASTGTPVLYTGTPADPYGISVVGQPWELRIGSAYHYDACESGQWTSFKLDLNSQSAIGSLITGGNPTALAIGDPVWVEPGTKTASYGDLSAKYPTPPGADVSILVVDAADLKNKGTTAIVAFAGFHITEIQGGSGKYLQGHFIPNFITPGASGVGPFFGTYTPPRLAQ